jgi:acetoin:2,6-dichlorophenolindophenol oxidoreductase subunit beta
MPRGSELGGDLSPTDRGKRAGWGAEIAAVVQEEAFDSLDAPIRRIGARNVPAPFSPPLEDHMMPSAGWIVDEVQCMLTNATG